MDNKKIERKEQLDLEQLQKLIADANYIYHLQLETNEMYNNVAARLREFRGTHYELYKEQLASTQTRLYFGSEFYPYFALNEIRLLLSELKGIAGIIEEVMIKATPEE